MNDWNETAEEQEVQVLAPTAIEALERASIDQQIATAHRYPRSLARFKRTALEIATVDPEVAETCFYKLKRGGNVIEGPSIRMAEVFAQAWGNLRIGARVIDEGEKYVTAQGVCHDLESNIQRSSEVRRRITNRDGKRYNDDMIITTMNAACAIATRNAVLGVVPAALQKPILRAVKQVSIGQAITMDERRGRIVQAFSKMGVSGEQIEAYLEKRIEEITLDDYELLKGTFNQLRDGEAEVDDVFPPAEKGAKKAPPPSAEPYRMGKELYGALAQSMGGENFEANYPKLCEFIKNIANNNPGGPVSPGSVEKDAIQNLPSFVSAYYRWSDLQPSGLPGLEPFDAIEQFKNLRAPGLTDFEKKYREELDACGEEVKAEWRAKWKRIMDADYIFPSQATSEATPEEREEVSARVYDAEEVLSAAEQEAGPVGRAAIEEMCRDTYKMSLETAYAEGKDLGKILDLVGGPDFNEAVAAKGE